MTQPDKISLREKDFQKDKSAPRDFQKDKSASRDFQKDKSAPREKDNFRDKDRNPQKDKSQDRVKKQPQKEVSTITYAKDTFRSKSPHTQAQQNLSNKPN